MYCLDPTTLLNLSEAMTRFLSNLFVSQHLAFVSFLGLVGQSVLLEAVPFSSVLFFFFFFPLFLGPFFHLPTHPLAMSCRDSVQALHCAGL